MEATKQAVEATKQAVTVLESATKTEKAAESRKRKEMENLFNQQKLDREAAFVQAAKDKKHELLVIEATTRSYNAQCKLSKAVSMAASRAESVPPPPQPAPAVLPPAPAAEPAAVSAVSVAPAGPAARSVEAAELVAEEVAEVAGAGGVDLAEAPAPSVSEEQAEQAEQAEIDVRASFMVLRSLQSDLNEIQMIGMINGDSTWNGICRALEEIWHTAMIYARPAAPLYDLQRLGKYEKLLRDLGAKLAPYEVSNTREYDMITKSLPDTIQQVMSTLAKHSAERPNANANTDEHQAAKQRLDEYLIELPQLKEKVKMAMDLCGSSIRVLQYCTEEKFLRASSALKSIMSSFNTLYLADYLHYGAYPPVVVEAAATALKLLTSIANFNGDMLDIAPPVDAAIAAFSIKKGSIHDWHPKVMSSSAYLFTEIDGFIRANVLPSAMGRVERQVAALVQGITAARQAKTRVSDAEWRRRQRMATADAQSAKSKRKRDDVVCLTGGRGEDEDFNCSDEDASERLRERKRSKSIPARSPLRADLLAAEVVAPSAPRQPMAPHEEADVCEEPQVMHAEAAVATSVEDDEAQQKGQTVLPLWCAPAYPSRLRDLTHNIQSRFNELPAILIHTSHPSVRGLSKASLPTSGLLLRDVIEPIRGEPYQGGKFRHPQGHGKQCVCLLCEACAEVIHQARQRPELEKALATRTIEAERLICLAGHINI